MRMINDNGIDKAYPTRQDIEDLKVGDFAPDCFGKMREIVSIHARGIDINGKAFVCFYVKWGAHNGRMSGSLKEDEIHIQA